MVGFNYRMVLEMKRAILQQSWDDLRRLWNESSQSEKLASQMLLYTIACDSDLNNKVKNNIYYEIILYFIAKGAYVDTYSGLPLVIAACRGDDRVVRKLLDSGAEAVLRDAYSLQLAASNGHESTVKLILSSIIKHYVDPSKKTLVNETNFDKEYVECRARSTIDSLTFEKIDKYITDSISWANLNGHHGVAEFLATLLQKSTFTIGLTNCCYRVNIDVVNEKITFRYTRLIDGTETTSFTQIE
jgi:ankyrin repeat protein